MSANTFDTTAEHILDHIHAAEKIVREMPEEMRVKLCREVMSSAIALNCHPEKYAGGLAAKENLNAILDNCGIGLRSHLEINLEGEIKDGSEFGN